MKRWNTIAASVALWALVHPGLSQENGVSPDDTIKAPVAVYKVSPKHPQALYELAIEGSAVVIVTVDMFGKAKEPEVESATHREFGIAASLAASEWQFEPATKNGIPIEIRVNLPFRFEIAMEHKLNVQLGREVFIALDVPVIASSDLPQAPVPSYVPPFSDFYPESLRGTGTSASVNLEFVISPTGQVLNPHIISISTEGFEQAALIAASHMTFHPVLVEGKPVYASIIRPIQIAE